MNPLRRAMLALAAVACVGGPAGCGLKGALTLPEKSGNVVIRGQPSGGTAPAEPVPQPPAPVPAPDKLPPPELPHSNSSSSR